MQNRKQQASGIAAAKFHSGTMERDSPSAPQERTTKSVPIHSLDAEAVAAVCKNNGLVCSPSSTRPEAGSFILSNHAKAASVSV